MNHPGPPQTPPAGPPPQGPQGPRQEKPWWVILLMVLGGLLALGILGIVVVLGLIAFACSRH